MQPFNTEDGRKYTTFLEYCAYYFKKGKNATEMQKMISAVYGEGAVTDRTRPKWFANFCAGELSMDDAPQLGRPVEVDSNQTERLIENILKISKSIVIGENEKCVFYFTEKTKWTF